MSPQMQVHQQQQLEGSPSRDSVTQLHAAKGKVAHPTKMLHVLLFVCHPHVALRYTSE